MASSASMQVPAAPLLYLGDARQRAARARLEKCIAAWRAEWSAASQRNGSTTLVPLDRSELMTPSKNSRSIAIAKFGGTLGVCAILEPAGVVATIGLPSSASTDCLRGALAVDVVNRMTISLARRVLSEAQYQPAQIEASTIAADDLTDLQFTHWWRADIDSGITICVAPQVLALLAPGNKPALTAQLEKRRAAIGEATVRLEAVLGQAEVSVGEFASLRVNDVIVLSGSLSQPVLLRNSSGRQVASATLGRMESKRAVVVTKLFENRDLK
ncbi:MAG TPA: FliM/FliN family flagellar motor C-terminal domain-containing protein [Steroidobacteraceae bacterium]|nr:FliM/FliN family flagellar motor C-terminal domain-containing protein [Steroidobacteraceae bacterium]